MTKRTQYEEKETKLYQWIATHSNTKEIINFIMAQLKLINTEKRIINISPSIRHSLTQKNLLGMSEAMFYDHIEFFVQHSFLKKVARGKYEVADIFIEFFKENKKFLEQDYDTK